jgi:hypothetical protein
MELSVFAFQLFIYTRARIAGAARPEKTFEIFMIHYIIYTDAFASIPTGSQMWILDLRSSNPQRQSSQ